MTCPNSLATILLDILQQGTLACRAAGWAGLPDRCAAEAEHIHNLPSLLANYSADRLAYYWEVERPSFAARCDAEQLAPWTELWDRLRPFVKNAGATVRTR